VQRTNDLQPVDNSALAALPMALGYGARNPLIPLMIMLIVSTNPTMCI
jgi:hypothetical protein